MDSRALLACSILLFGLDYTANEEVASVSKTHRDGQTDKRDPDSQVGSGPREKSDDVDRPATNRAGQKEADLQPPDDTQVIKPQDITEGKDAAKGQSTDIPKFDLADQIMAEHRKNTSIRRKGPAKKAKHPKKQHPAELIARNVEPGPIVSGPQQIIAEIVARDIENLCIGNTP